MRGAATLTVLRDKRLWAAAAMLAALSAVSSLVPWTASYPAAWKLPIDDVITTWLKYIVSHISPVTRALASVVQLPLDLVTALLVKGFAFNIGETHIELPALSWLGLSGLLVWAGYWASGFRLAALQAAGCAYLLLFGQWDGAMLTLASVLVCVPIAVITGLLVGVLAHARQSVNTWLLTPGLDIMQTVPAFAYLIPTLLLFGFGPVAAMIATVIFAMPPMARVTALVLDQAPQEIRELATMIGCSKRQAIWRILLPSARPMLLVGLNQTVMMTLNMVIIASMIGAGGLGFDVLRALRQLDIDRGFVSGTAIVVIAIMLDRLGAAVANRARPDVEQAPGWGQSLILPLGWLLAATLAGVWIEWLAKFPDALRLSTGGVLNATVSWINVNFFDAMEALRIFTLKNLMNPIKFFLADMPWLVLAGLVTLAAYFIAGLRLALLSVLVLGFCLVTGLWDKVMITLYLCLSATVVSALIGIPLAVAAARYDALYRAANVAVELLQTLPSFVYLIPVVMLFRVGDFAALLAIVAFAITPIVKFTMTALRTVPSDLVEAGQSMGCSRFQLDRLIRLPVALPTILLGINQAILFALAMVVITALVGTRDLGQEVYIALTTANPGRGLVAGLCLAFLGILIDRMFRAGASRLQHTTTAGAA